MSTKIDGARDAGAFMDAFHHEGRRCRLIGLAAAVVFTLAACGRDLPSNAGCSTTLVGEHIVFGKKCPFGEVLIGIDGTSLSCATQVVTCP